MDDELARIHPVTLRFADAGLEQAFREEQARKTLKPLRAAIVASSAAILVFWALLPDILPQVPNARGRLATPMLVILAILAYGYARSHTKSFLRMQQPYLLAGALGMAAAAVGIGALLPRAALDSTGLVIGVLHTLNVYSAMRLRFPWGCYAGWGTAVIYLGYFSHTGTLEGADLVRHAGMLLMANLFGMIAAYQVDQSARREFDAMRMLGKERERSERLLLNILPAAIAERLKTSPESIAEHSPDVTVLFADIVGFTPLSASKSPQDLVRLLDRIFSEFDAVAEKHGLEKIKTIGDAYMAAAGLPQRCADHAPARVAALSMPAFPASLMQACSRSGRSRSSPGSENFTTHWWRFISISAFGRAPPSVPPGWIRRRSASATGSLASTRRTTSWMACTSARRGSGADGEGS